MRVDNGRPVLFSVANPKNIDVTFPTRYSSLQLHLRPVICIFEKQSNRERMHKPPRRTAKSKTPIREKNEKDKAPIPEWNRSKVEIRINGRRATKKERQSQRIEKILNELAIIPIY